MSGEELLEVTLAACEVFWTQPDAWRALMVQAMGADFGWGRAAGEYLAIYRELCPGDSPSAAADDVAAAPTVSPSDGRGATTPHDEARSEKRKEAARRKRRRRAAAKRGR